jgi:hypothetical protein
MLTVSVESRAFHFLFPSGFHARRGGFLVAKSAHLTLVYCFAVPETTRFECFKPSLLDVDQI